MNRTNTKKSIIALVAIVALVAILGICLVACNADTYKNKLEKKGYRVETISADKIPSIGDLDVEWAVSATKLTDSVMIIKFKTADDAKAFQKNLIGKLGSSSTSSRSGSLIRFGTKQGVKDSE